MPTVAGSRSEAEPPQTGRVCRKCHQPVTVQGDPAWGKAVHTDTGKETGSGGHVAAPIDAGLVREAMALKASEGS